MTTAYIATTGGHLTQLTELAQRIPPDPDAVWVTHAGSGPHWNYGGGGFDAYELVPGVAPFGERIRVVVTVGTAMEFPFARLMRALVPLLEPGGDLERVTGLPVDVLWQTGCTPTDGLPLTATPFLPAADLTAALAEADIVVSHAGTGSVLANLAAGRFAVVVSRLAKFGEAVDDHQQELAEELVERGLAIHRDPEKITVDDLLDTRQHAVRRVPHVPPFVLR